MISAVDIGLHFGARKLFDGVNIKFLPGNCYGLIGANGSGKTTFLKILARELEPSCGEIVIDKRRRLAVLKQDHFEFDDEVVVDTVIRGHKRLHAIIEERNHLYAMPDFSEEDGMRAAELEQEFGELNGWDAETDAAKLLCELEIPPSHHQLKVRDLSDKDKLKVLLAQALFGKPDILLMDEPTNHLDIKTVKWLEEFIKRLEGTVIVVSHDRHFLNQVCTHMADIDFGKIELFVGNYDFWYESSQLLLRMAAEQNRRKEEKAKELKAFIARFSANASKSKQATSRQKQLEKLTFEEMKPSSRRYPFVRFQPEREAGKNILQIEGLSHAAGDSKLFGDIHLLVEKGDKILVTANNDVSVTTFLQILAGDVEPDSGKCEWGVTTSLAYFPKDNSSFFAASNKTLVEWLSEYSEDKSEVFLRGFLGRMLFSGDEALKRVSVLSGGEKVRCMLSRMMLSSANCLLLDGPTNHLDLESITALNNGLMAFRGTILFSSPDRQFNETVATKVLELTENGAKVYLGGYQDYEDSLH